ncbi:MAG: Cof-type HAD-IIB family hydrolase [Firmicutes bacterium]|nr:Cof-type HAD-IIB family hydrolase [Bacillota bacterium]MCL5039260.1 Cof-type HAD-IIB family hydrolase [Bacillota bacterium]
MKYRLVALDMDGTLLNDQYEISPRTAAAIARAVSRGVLVTLATGRTFRSAYFYAKDLGLNLPLIAYNGGLIKEVFSGEIHLNRPIYLPTARALVDFLQGRGHYLKVYIDDKLFVAKETEETVAFASRHRIMYEAVGDLKPFLTKEPSMMVVVEAEETVNALKDWLDRDWHNKISSFKSNPRSLDIVHPEASKAEALRFLARKFRVRSEEVLAIGNEMNDLEMIGWSGLGVAMGNASSFVLGRADYVTADNNHDGVAEVLERFVL